MADVDRSTLDDQNRDVVYERDLEKVIEDQEEPGTYDENARPGLLEGEPFIPPVQATGPASGAPGVSGVGTFGGTTGLPLPIVPVVDTDRDRGEAIEGGVLVNPFTPADPDNEKPFRADVASPLDLAARVEAELAADGRFNAADITVVEDGGAIRLEGTAPTVEVAMDAARVAARVPGVNAVENEIRPLDAA